MHVVVLPAPSYRPVASPLVLRRSATVRPSVARQCGAARAAPVGIDLGTSNSAIAVVEGGRVVILSDESGSAVTPSIVSYTEDDVLVGVSAAAGKPENTFYSVKRLIGRSLPEVSGDVGDLRYGVVACTEETGASGGGSAADSCGSGSTAAAASDGRNGTAATATTVADGGGGAAVSGSGSGALATGASHGSGGAGAKRSESDVPAGSEGSGSVRLRCPARQSLLAPEEVSAVLLRHLLLRAAGRLESPVQNAVVTVPAHFGSSRRTATHRAARLAGLQGVHLLQEPVAAAIAYGLNRPEDADTILVVDLGGGTLDISILESFEGIIEVLATDGDSRLGGDDFDRLIARWALQQCRQAGHTPRSQDAKDVMQQAEAAKVALSADDSAAVSIPLAGGGAFQAVLSVEDLETAIQPLLRRLWEPMARCGKAVFLEWAERPFSSGDREVVTVSAAAATDRFAPPPRRITKALLVGGGTRMPAIQHLVQQATGVRPDSSIDPELCVAIGAGIQAESFTADTDGGLEAGILAGDIEGGLEVMDGSFVQQLHSRSTGLSAFESVAWEP